MECCICFSNEDEDTDLNFIKCIKCDSNICQDCMSRYIEISSTKLNTLPTCPNKCGCEYFYDTLKKFDELIDSYIVLLYNYLKNNPKFEIIVKESHKDIIEKIIKDKKQYIKKEFPKCVVKIINICMADKIKYIPKNSASKNTIINRKKCINSFCIKGLLILNSDEDIKEYECNHCKTIFCTDCEKEKKYGHLCKKDDIDSLKYLNNMKKCPECHIKVEKSEGCNTMTCTNCKTNFSYDTGLKMDYGNNHNANINLNDPESYKFSRLYNDIYDKKIIKFLYKIENKEPITYEKGKTKLLKILEDIINYEEEKKKKDEEDEDSKNENDEKDDKKTIKLKIKLYKEYSKYMSNVIDIKDYFEKLGEIQRLHTEKELDLKKLKILFPDI